MAYKTKESQAAAAKKHYEANKAIYKSRAIKHKEKVKKEVRAFILEFLKNNPCTDCGEPDPVVLEFDHKVNAAKRFEIGNAIRSSYSLKSVKKEIEKCDVRCANCHRRVTYKQFGRGHRG